MRTTALSFLTFILAFCSATLCLCNALLSREGEVISTSTRGVSFRKAGLAPLYDSYGRGANIWPPRNEGRIRVTDSFPDGVLPADIVDALSASDSQSSTVGMKVSSRTTTQQIISRAVKRILRRAANAQEEEDSSLASISTTPVVLALILGVSGLIRPLDVLIASFLSGYFVLLARWSKFPRVDGSRELLPYLPPQGHVPALVSEPLGPVVAMRSSEYDVWLKIGGVGGYFLPILALCRYVAMRQWTYASACARPIFLLSCQALSEAVARQYRTPLPIRILIPVAYNTVRLGYLWNWMSQTTGVVDPLGQGLAIANFTYWLANLFGFLLPVAVIRYMRAHFFCVEAAEVRVRPGDEEYLGLLQ